MNTENKEVLAKVSDVEITRTDVNNFIANLGANAYRFKNEEGIKKVTDELVAQQLMYYDALDRGLDKEEAFVTELEKSGEALLKQYAISKLVKDVSVSDEEIKEFYEQNKENFKEKMKFNADHILVADETLANEIHDKIVNGENFEQLAKEYSTCPSKEKGGNLGTFTEGQMVKEFEDAVKTMELGSISGPVKTQFGYHIVRLNERNEESFTPIEKVKSQINDYLLKQKQQELYATKAKELEDKYKVEKFY